MKRGRRLVTPLAVGLVVACAAALIIWGLTQGSTMFSPGGLNAQAKTAAPAGAAPAAAQASATGQTGSLGGVSTHAALGSDCAACHAVPFSTATMAEKCLGCHKDVQQEMATRTALHGALLANGWTGTCGGCHTEHHGAAGILTVIDPSFPHDITGFVLRGPHQEMPCERCHGQDLKTFDSATCIDCHSRIDQAFMTRHIATFGSTCVPCHNGAEGAGRNFDHDRFAFKLTGKHEALPCESCHKGATTLTALQQTPQDCYSCHAKDDAHAGKFGKDCAGCHSTTDWKQATFDHSQTSFPLTGAHATVACDKCHSGGQFTAISSDCVSCHAEPVFHQGAFGTQSTQCASCHATTAWTPAKFDLSHALFPLDHGSREQTPTCKTCHPTSLSAYTCLNCHAHSPDSVVAEHEGASLAQLRDCIRCHQGGRGGGD
jgi:hypothetical protein